MAEYHVGCGALGIYAGTLNPPRKDGVQLWRNKSPVTEEAVGAVVKYYKQEMDLDGDTSRSTDFVMSPGGEHLRLTVEYV